MLESALESAQFARRLGLKKDKIILSVKMSDLPATLEIYQRLAKECDYALHLGLTEAGSQLQGIVSSTAALAILLQQGIGDTIRVSLTPQPDLPRTTEIAVCKELLQAIRLRHFSPRIISCPGCGRTKKKYFETLNTAIRDYIEKNVTGWKRKYPGVERLSIAIMGCVVNGPGESKFADIGLCLPGAAEQPQAVVFANGCKFKTLQGPRIEKQFLKLLEDYLRNKFQGHKFQGHET
ncbi:4-hydroxy-3-methylbut-2-en-1-yl diphosphate synthase [sediment metagenome]|uniref:4-hydroxy-3-methylbut-2-en-1-yl diphosphate synthase n=1 Tax=sediment metagenome TaxID=749907 RepID=D9PJE3_9ZZZZ